MEHWSIGIYILRVLSLAWTPPEICIHPILKDVICSLIHCKGTKLNSLKFCNSDKESPFFGLHLKKNLRSLLARQSSSESTFVDGKGDGGCLSIWVAWGIEDRKDYLAAKPRQGHSGPKATLNIEHQQLAWHSRRFGLFIWIAEDSRTGLNRE